MIRRVVLKDSKNPFNSLRISFTLDSSKKDECAYMFCAYILGAVKSEFLEIFLNVNKAKSDDILEGVAKKYPLRRVGEPMDVAQAVLYLT
ncbi:unnamed protein product [Oppiella nova]|uniref:Uncharacterized protein n=1 Tax=Oppiella nova TaxID=334625 RepID=A0A7R9QP52_9ACAR|nr:unnamed protein product [Oppiella nova]CAG2170299.1 unnamed protein product [Oppiella nova]